MSFAAVTREGGMCFAFPDVCKVPAPPSPSGVPLPLPNLGQCSDADAGTCSQNTLVRNKPVLVSTSEITQSSGDEAGTLGGVVSSTHMSKVTFRTSSSKVTIEGTPAVMHLATTAHNGSNANAPAGTHVSPSQSQVMLGG
ncbi:MAG: DUF4150 domain-containing protein [Deltaproteobacteria bacterium]|nr:DUF4150 domain-containing protein [Deltaproteobacteria bacterium]